MSKKKGKKLIEVLKREKLENHPGKIDTVWLSEEEKEILQSAKENKFEWVSPGLELVGGGTVRVDDGDILIDALAYFSPSTLDLLADVLSTRLFPFDSEEK